MQQEQRKKNPNSQPLRRRLACVSTAIPMEPGAGDESAQEPRRTRFRDIRRYYCHVCGICRSKKDLITAHILSHHKEEVGEEEEKAAAPEEELSRKTCEECGASFQKLAYLKQHMQSHSVEDYIFFE